MTNHPNRRRGPYTAQLGGSSWAVGPQAEFATIRGARAWAEEYGAGADFCTITDKKGRVVGEHRRDQNGDGMSWYCAEPTE